jgi:hypothetical protein
LINIHANGKDETLLFAGFLKFEGKTNGQLEISRGVPKVKITATYNGTVSTCELLVEESISHRITVDNTSITLRVHDVGPMFLAEDLLDVQIGEKVPHRRMKLEYTLGDGLGEGTVIQNDREMMCRVGNAEFQLEFIGIVAHGKTDNMK